MIELMFSIRNTQQVCSAEVHVDGDHNSVASAAMTWVVSQDRRDRQQDRNSRDDRGEGESEERLDEVIFSPELELDEEPSRVAPLLVMLAQTLA